MKSLNYVFLVCLLGVQTTVCACPAFADEIKLEQRQPTLDTNIPKTTTLNGQVSTEGSGGQPLDNIDITPGPGKLVIQMRSNRGDARLTAEQVDAINRLINSNRHHTFSMQANTRTFFGTTGKAKMSVEDFRKLQYGVVGMVSIAGSAQPVVLEVFPTCPAAIAGIKPGDQVVKGNDHVFRIGEGQKEMWQVCGGKAGSPIDITVLRDGQLITFHLMRMNMEDIQDDNVRHRYEFLLSAFGPPLDSGSEPSAVKNSSSAEDQE